MLSSLLVYGLLAGSAMAQSSATATTATTLSTSTAAPGSSTPADDYPSATLLLPSNVGTGLAGSVIHVAACDTTYAMRCTDSALCPPITASVTQAASSFIVAVFVTLSDETRFTSASCSMLNLNSAACSTYLSTVSGESTATTSVTTTFSGSQIHYGQIPLTAGAEALTAANRPTCATSVTASAAAAASVSDASNSSSNGDNDLGTRIGIGVGVGLGVALVLGAMGGYLLYRRHAKKKAKKAAAARDAEDRKATDGVHPAPPAYNAATSPTSPMSQTTPLSMHQPLAPVQLDSQPVPTAEMHAEEKRFEMGDEQSPKAQRAPTERFELPTGK